MSDLIIGGEKIGKIVSFDFKTDPMTDSKPLAGCLQIEGGFREVTGTLTCYFENTTLLEAFRQGEVKLQKNLRKAFEPYLPKPLWKRVLRKVFWVATVLAILTLTTGAM